MTDTIIGIAIGAALYAALLPAVGALRSMAQLKMKRLEAAENAADNARAEAVHAANRVARVDAEVKELMSKTNALLVKQGMSPQEWQ